MRMSIYQTNQKLGLDIEKQVMESQFILDCYFTTLASNQMWYLILLL